MGNKGMKCKRHKFTQVKGGQARRCATFKDAAKKK